MTPLKAFRIRTVACIAGLVLVASACGSSSTSDSTVVDADPIEDATATTAATPEDAATTVATEAAPSSEAAPTETPGETGGGSGDVQIELDDGRTWSLTASTCTFNPDATGPAAAVVNIGGFNDDGVELGALEAWPFDGSTDTGTAFIGNFVDENDDLYIFVSHSVAMVDGAVELTADYQTDVFYEEGDEPVGFVTVRCTP